MFGSFSALVKAQLCAKTRTAFGMEPGETNAFDCCKLSFFTAALLFAGARESDGGFLIKSENGAFLDLVATLGAAAYSLTPNLVTSRGGQMLRFANSPTLTRTLRAAGVAEGQKALPVLLCGDCIGYFLRAVFLSCGTVANPAADYHLALFAHTHADALYSLCREADIPMRRGTRREKPILYLKDCDSIADFLTRVGAHAAAMDMMNAQMEKSVRALINRQNNFDTANLSRTLAFNRRFADAVETLKKTGRYDMLPPPLKEVARARLRYPGDTLSRLGERLSPKLSKSGLYHRAKKLIAIAEQSR